MSVGPFNVYSEALEALIRAELGDLTSQTMSAVLLSAAHTPDLEAHATFADVSADEIVGGDYARQMLSGLALADTTGGGQWDSADVSFGNPVTIPACKYLVFVVGAPGALAGTSKLLGIVDLDTASGAATVFSINAEFTVQAPVGGWFSLTRQ